MQTTTPDSRPPRGSIHDPPPVPPADPVEAKPPPNVASLDRASKKAIARNQQTQAELAIKLAGFKELALNAQETAKRACEVLKCFIMGQQEVNAYKIDGADVIIIRHTGELQFKAEIVQEISVMMGKPVLTLMEGQELQGTTAEQMEKAGWVRKIQLVSPGGTAL